MASLIVMSLQSSDYSIHYMKKTSHQRAKSGGNKVGVLREEARPQAEPGLGSEAPSRVVEGGWFEEVGGKRWLRGKGKVGGGAKPQAEPGLG